MNKFHKSNLLRLIAFFLTATVLCCTFGFTVDGWRVRKGNNPINGNELAGSDMNQESNFEGSENENKDDEEVIAPIFINPMTGKEDNPENMLTHPLSFVIDGSSPTYGISCADILIDLPVENDSSRYLCITSKYSNLWKIGSLAPTRSYITNLAAFFGTDIISYGSDDFASYDKCDNQNKIIDISVDNDKYYTEYGKYIFTSFNILSDGQSDPAPANEEGIKLPFQFIDYRHEPITFQDNAEKAKIKISEMNYIEVAFDEETRCYSISKSGELIRESSNGEIQFFNNCLILFADSVTYDLFSYNQTIVQTLGRGKGLCFTEGTITKVEWISDSIGNMKIIDKNGNIITMNTGRTYMLFQKASRMENVEIT